MKTSLLILFTTVALLQPCAAVMAHPGCRHTSADLQRIRTEVAAGHEPWKRVWEALQKSDADIHYQAHVKPAVTDQ